MAICDTYFSSDKLTCLLFTCETISNHDYDVLNCRKVPILLEVVYQLQIATFSMHCHKWYLATC